MEIDTTADNINAQVIAVFPDKVRIVVDDLENFKIAEESLKVGSYLKIADNELKFRGSKNPVLII